MRPATTHLVTGAAMVAGVVGAPVRHSLSPLIHNAWIAEAGLDAAYVPFAAAESGFGRLIDGLRHGSVRGLNVTLPFKLVALELADEADAAARMAGAANLLLFQAGRIVARNTDGMGLLSAFAEQAPGWRADVKPVTVVGAGGASRGAVAALVAAGATVRVVNRTLDRARALAAAFRGVDAFPMERFAQALADCGTVINASSAGLVDGDASAVPFEVMAPGAVAMDMTYRPLRTRFMTAAGAAGLRTVDGLAMLIGQAVPSFEAFYGAPPPTAVDVRRLALLALDAPSR